MNPLKADLYLRPTGANANAYLKAGDILREDGRYTVRLTDKDPNWRMFAEFLYFGKIIE